MLAFIIFTTLTIAIFLSIIAVFTDEIKHKDPHKDTLKDMFNDK